jgi:hypothetical protein
MVALIHPDLRVRYSTSHPKDMGDDVLHMMAKYENICKYVHLPVQSGNSDVLEKMNRGYTREWYLDRIAAIRRIMPDAAISADIITGFCGETDQEHQDTISLMQEVKFVFAYMFKYSERPKTLAERRFEDDVPDAIKGSRLNEIIELLKNLNETHLKKGKEYFMKVLKGNKIVKENKEFYNNVSYLVSTEKTPSNIKKINESINYIVRLMLEKEVEKEVVVETVNLPSSVLTSLAVNKFNSKYSDISETEKEIIKTLLNGSDENKESIFNKLKRECIDGIDTKLTESTDLELKDKLLKVKDKLLTTNFKLESFKTDITKIYDLKQSI